MKRKSLLSFVLCLLVTAITVIPSNAATLDTKADLVLGQDLFTDNTTNSGASNVNSAGFNDPVAVAIDRSVSYNRVYVVDFNNNRVLGWANLESLYNGATADMVIGQPDFSSRLPNRGGTPRAYTLWSPQGATVDSAGNLYVADRGNSRVLVYFTPFVTTAVPGSGDTVADQVVGQTNFTSGGCSNPSSSTASASSLCDPYGVALDGAGNLYVADMANNRVLEYDTPLTTAAAANRVFGQPNFTSRSAGSGASGLNQPNGLTVDNMGNLYVADFQNNRVLEYDSPLTTNTVADHVFGQGGSFTSNSANKGGISASSLYNPSGVAADSEGNVYVADRSNRRVLEYDTPLTTNTVADRVFGQGNVFTTVMCNKGGVSESSLCFPAGVAVDGPRSLWVADFANHRALEYDTPVPDSTLPDAPTNLTNTPGDGLVTLNWTQSVSTDVVQQRLYRSLTSGGPYTLLATFNNTTTNSYVDPGLTNGTPYYYVATAVDSSGNESSYSSPEDISTPIDNVAPEAPTDLTNVPGDGSVTLVWNPSVSTDVVQQKLYRSETSGGPYTVVATFNDNTTNVYVDTTVTNGTTYYYVATAVDASNNESGYSSPEDISTPQAAPAGVIPIAHIHFEELPDSAGSSEHGARKCSLQTTVEFTFEDPPGVPSPSSGGHDTNDVHPPSVVVTMTFPDSFVATPGPGVGKKETHEEPHALGYVKEYEVRFDCDTMEAHVGLGQNVTVNISGRFNSDGVPFSGSAVLTTHN